VRGGVVADVEAGATRREHEVDVVGFVLDVASALRIAAIPSHVTGELLGEAE
jgi:hypothetical protein